MTRGTLSPLEIADRLILAIVGLALIALGSAVLLAALDLVRLPSPADVAQTTADYLLVMWPAAAVVAVASVIAVLGAAITLRHLMPARRPRAVSELTLPSAPGRHRTELRGRALAKVVEQDLAHGSHIGSASARLVGASPPAIEAQITTPLTCDLEELRNHAAEVAGRLDEALGRSDCELHIRARFVEARDHRVE
jgi:hypothetical protein